MTGAPALANIGPRGRRLRLIVGVADLLAAAGLVLAIQWAGLSPWWRLAAFPLLFVAALGVLQARASTCVALAARRTCDAELGRLTEADAEILAGRGRDILRQATIVAAAATLLTLLI
jgi:hypothetical protein